MAQQRRKNARTITESSPKHPRWDEAKLIEIQQFRSLQEMDTIPISHSQIQRFSTLTPGTAVNLPIEEVASHSSALGIVYKAS